MNDNDLLMIVLEFVFGYCLQGMMKNMCGERLVEGNILGDGFSVIGNGLSWIGRGVAVAGGAIAGGGAESSCSNDDDCFVTFTCNNKNICQQ